MTDETQFFKYTPPGGPADVDPVDPGIEFTMEEEVPIPKGPQKINGKIVVANMIVMPDEETQWLAAVLKCNCPAKAGLELHPLSRDLRSFAGMDLATVRELLRQQGWNFKVIWEKDENGKALAER